VLTKGLAGGSYSGGLGSAAEDEQSLSRL